MAKKNQGRTHQASQAKRPAPATRDAVAKAVDMKELGVPGVKKSAGKILEEPLRYLQGERGQKIFQEMAYNDDVVGASLLAVTHLVRQVDWWEEPADNSPEAEEVAEFSRGIRDDMSHSWEDFTATIMSMMPFGWSYFEMVYKRRNGLIIASPGESSKYEDSRIGIRKIDLRRQMTLERWVFDEDGGLRGLVQLVDGKRYFVPIEKSLLFRFGADKQNPEGTSALRNAWRSWYFKKRLQETEAIGAERELTGMVVTWVPAEILAGTSPKDQEVVREFELFASRIKRDEQEGIVFPLAYDADGNKLYDLTLLASPGSRAFATDPMINRYDRGIAGSLLADFILLGHESSGSWALSSDKTNLFSVSLGAILDDIGAILNRHYMPRIMGLNGVPTRLQPRLVHGDIEKTNLKEVAEFISALTAAGLPLFPDEALEAHLLNLADLPASGSSQVL